MERFSKLEKDSKVVLIIATILILTMGIRAMYANVNGYDRLETIRRNSRLNFVSLKVR